MTICWDGVYMGWTSWATRVIDITLETWSMTVVQGHYAGACVEVSFRDILWGMPKQRMLCRCCCAMETYELVERLYTLVQQGHEQNMLQMGWRFHGPEHGNWKNS